jgi:hypothetical protein
MPTQPLGQSRWAGLEPRINKWAQLLHMPIKDCALLRTRSSGVTVISLEGWPEPTVFLSDAFLEASDWRQQDAALTLLFGYWQARGTRWQSAILVIAAQSFLLVAAYWLLAATPLRTESSPLLAATDVGARALVMAGFSLWFVYGHLMDRHLSTASFRADRFAAKITGDPKAVLAALHTIGALANNPAAVSLRLRRLNTLRTEPGYRAPWAAAPVPSAIPLTHC